MIIVWPKGNRKGAGAVSIGKIVPRIVWNNPQSYEGQLTHHTDTSVSGIFNQTHSTDTYLSVGRLVTEDPCASWASLYAHTPFSNVNVNYSVNGDALIEWSIYPEFYDATPYTFQLQYGTTGHPNADDWINVGKPQADVTFIIDTTKRNYGKHFDAHYRVVLSTIRDTYFSDPVNASNWLDPYKLRITKELWRKEKLRHRLFASVDGYLLFRRRYGPKCTSCLEPVTDEVNNPDCLECFGTGIQGGYFTPLCNVTAELSNIASREALDVQARGKTEDITQQARFLGIPKLRSYDIWISKRSDKRYYVHSVQEPARIGETPIVQVAEVRLAPFTDIIYKFPLLSS